MMESDSSKSIPKTYLEKNQKEKSTGFTAGSPPAETANLPEEKEGLEK